MNGPVALVIWDPSATSLGKRSPRAVGATRMKPRRQSPRPANYDFAARGERRFLPPRFKGFERPFAIVTELGDDERRDGYDTRMYIALTRATAEVAVVCTDAEIGHDARLAGESRNC